MKKYILITDFSLTAPNRGTAALGYGALSFLMEKGYIKDGQSIIEITFDRIPFRKSFYTLEKVQGHDIRFYHLRSTIYEYKLLVKFGVIFSFLPLGNMIKNLGLVAAINGGDGFSDIYGDYLYKSRLLYINVAMKMNLPLVILPQTIGPFDKRENLRKAEEILKYADSVFVRDNKFIKELDRMGVHYEMTKDLSAFMKPEKCDINVEPDSIGINVSGLAYSNKFLNLAGQFKYYPELIDRLIKLFQNKGKTVYIIPHAYNYEFPEENNDDIVACRLAYEKHTDKTNVILIDKDLISPHVKYLISKMSFFCGTRMHANFAAIYTNVPVFGLAYSYKFAGAFEANGLSSEQTCMINNIEESQIDDILKKIDDFYNINVN